MYITGIGVDVHQTPLTDEESRDDYNGDKCVYFPDNLEAWKNSIYNSGGVRIHVSSTFDPGHTCITIGDIDGSGDYLEDRKAFGLVVDINTLLELQGAIGAAIAAAK